MTGRRLAEDAGLALLLVAVCVGASVHQAPHQPRAVGLAVLAALSLAVRRTWPLVNLAVATVAASTYLVLGYPYGPILLTVLIAVYTVARYRPIRPAALAAAAALVVLAVHAFVGHGPGWFGLVPGSAWIVVPFALGVSLRLHAENAARARARHADEERLRVAQEVHDVVGHGLSAIQMQAEIALHVLPKQPEHAVTALAAISRTSREALDELRVTLALVRSDARAPLPGLARIEALAGRTSDSGVPVRVQTTGAPRPLPGAVDLAAYRVVQESLTNVLRHAGPAAATVRMDYGPDEVCVEISDTGVGPGIGDVGGAGIAGMRQRVAALGGTLSAGPGERGGFRVAARIPAP
jgi:signal transduction histidine kinase